MRTLQTGLKKLLYELCNIDRGNEIQNILFDLMPLPPPWRNCCNEEEELAAVVMGNWKRVFIQNGRHILVICCFL